MKKITALFMILGLQMGVAQAAPTWDFRYTDTISSSNIPGVSVGDTVVVNLFGNNGNSAIASQSFAASDMQGFTIDVGTYHATYSKIWQSFSLATDALGNVSAIQFFGTDDFSNNTDNFGSWVGDYVFGNFSFHAFDYDLVANVADNTFNTVEHWSVSQADVPEPASLALLGIGLAGASLSRRKRS